MLLLARYKATTFDELFDGVYSIPVGGVFCLRTLLSRSQALP